MKNRIGRAPPGNYDSGAKLATTGGTADYTHKVLAVRRSHPEERGAIATVGAICAAWLVYTLWYGSAPSNRIGLPCLFYHLTGHPCPFCGGTRAYAAMWHLDLGSAAHFYPLAPLMFPTTFAVVGYSAWSLLSRRGVYVHVPRWAWWLAGIAGVAVLATSWILKWVWLGN
jgi:hypothetical protein